MIEIEVVHHENGHRVFTTDAAKFLLQVDDILTYNYGTYIVTSVRHRFGSRISPEHSLLVYVKEYD